MINQIITKQWEVKRMPRKIIAQNSLAMRAKTAREALGLTQQELAAVLSSPPYNLKITTSGYSKIEKATTETPRAEVPRALKHIFGVSIDYLLDGEEPEEEKSVDAFISEEANLAGALIDQMVPDMRRFAVQILTNIREMDTTFKSQKVDLERTIRQLRQRREQMAQLLVDAMPDLKEAAQRRARSLLHDIESGSDKL